MQALNGLTVGKLNLGLKAADTLNWTHAGLAEEIAPLAKGEICWALAGRPQKGYTQKQ